MISIWLAHRALRLAVDTPSLFWKRKAVGRGTHDSHLWGTRVAYNVQLYIHPEVGQCSAGRSWYYGATSSVPRVTIAMMRTIIIGLYIFEVGLRNLLKDVRDLNVYRPFFHITSLI